MASLSITVNSFYFGGNWSTPSGNLISGHDALQLGASALPLLVAPDGIEAGLVPARAVLALDVKELELDAVKLKC